LKNVILATTHWSSASEKGLDLRQKELKETFWADMIKHGSRVRSHDGTTTSARKITSDLVKKKTIVPKITDELVNKKLAFSQTEAGKMVNEDLEAYRKEHEDEMAHMKREREQDKAKMEQYEKELKDIKKSQEEMKQKLEVRKVKSMPPLPSLPPLPSFATSSHSRFSRWLGALCWFIISAIKILWGIAICKDGAHDDVESLWFPAHSLFWIVFSFLFWTHGPGTVYTFITVSYIVCGLLIQSNVIGFARGFTTGVVEERKRSEQYSSALVQANSEKSALQSQLQIEARSRERLEDRERKVARREARVERNAERDRYCYAGCRCRECRRWYWN
jgi:hypothetical protein